MGSRVVEWGLELWSGEILNHVLLIPTSHGHSIIFTTIQYEEEDGLAVGAEGGQLRDGVTAGAGVTDLLDLVDMAGHTLTRPGPAPVNVDQQQSGCGQRSRPLLRAAEQHAGYLAKQKVTEHSFGWRTVQLLVG